MKGSIISVFVVSSALSFSVSAQAQQAAPKEHSMTGCLQKGAEPNTYMVTDVEGKGPKTIGVVSSSANLAPHVGHKIEVTGTAVPAKEAEVDKNVPKAEHYMKLTAIKMISTSCP
jgi:pyruvate/2-oxoglutarate dehydrogenase complex dihydrolipoamide acyltransferase (E2) component